MGKMDRLNTAIGRLHDDLSFRDLHIYHWDYTKQSGEKIWSKSEHPDSPIQGEWVEPQEPTTETDAQGNEATVDVRIRIPDDTGISIVTAGEDGEHPTTVEDGLSGKTAEVWSLHDEGNGLLLLNGVVD